MYKYIYIYMRERERYMIVYPIHTYIYIYVYIFIFIIYIYITCVCIGFTWYGKGLIDLTRTLIELLELIDRFRGTGRAPRLLRHLYNS